MALSLISTEIKCNAIFHPGGKRESNDQKNHSEQRNERRSRSKMTNSNNPTKRGKKRDQGNGIYEKWRNEIQKSSSSGRTFTTVPSNDKGYTSR